VKAVSETAQIDTRLEDAELVESFRRGRMAAYEELFERYPNFRSSDPPLTFFRLLGRQVSHKARQPSFVFIVAQQRVGESAARTRV
jgi:hypothetical protein